ncbi:hypothetical protein [Paenibacillus sp. GYB003]|uniref:hypothetical protein n=1 Tax=Paenibacillus sp. GYB003 TaxID=2994392 RepID=UPI002F968130
MIREWYVRVGTVSTLAAVLAAGFFGYYNWNPDAFAASPSPAQAAPLAPPERDQLFDPGAVRPGDVVAGMSAASVSAGTHGVRSVTVRFEGAKTVSGRFEVMGRETEPYNPGDVIFTVDDRSASLLPKAKTFHEVPNRFSLRFANPDDRAKFGDAGSTGTGSIVVTDYTAVYADILEGTSDTATLGEIRTLHVIPPKSPEENNPDFDKAMLPFPALKLEPKRAVANPLAVYEWLESVEKSFYGLAYNGKPISAAQRDKVRLWLLGAFTESRAERLLLSHVPETEGGYLINGASSGLIPPVIVKDVAEPKLTAAADGTYEFAVTLVVSGTRDAKLTCTLQYGKNGWKIDDYAYVMM